MDSVVDAYPLNATHRGILFHSLQCEEDDVYLSIISMRIQGVLDTNLLQQAWQHVFTHHPSLRSSVVFDGLDEPLWIVHENIDPVWEILDFSSLTETEREQKERDVHASLTQIKFGFSSEALMKFTLIRLNENTYKLLWAIHHILSDGWSTAVALEDLSIAYEACVRGKAPSLLPTIEYGHFLDTQSTLDTEPLKAYWSDYLQDKSPTPFKLRESLREPAQVHKEAFETRIQLDENRSRAIAEAARRVTTTSSALFVAAWGLVLRDLCQHASPLFGVTLSGRPARLSSIERGVGLYITTVPLYTDTAQMQSVKDWLSGIGKSLQAHAEQDALALVDIQKLANRESNEPLFSSVIALSGHDSELCYGSVNNNIQIDSVEYHIRSHFELSMLIKPGERTAVHLISQSEKLDATSNDAILESFINALDSLVDASRTADSMLPQLCDIRGQESLDSGISVTPPRFQRIDDWILDIAERQPSSIALLQGNNSLTYTALVQKAQRVGQRLQSKLNDLDRPVAISLSNGIDAFVAMLGVLLSGRYYIPLDPQQPIERQLALCDDADCALIIAEYPVVSSLSESIGSVWQQGDKQPFQITTIETLLANVDVRTDIDGSAETSSNQVAQNAQSPAYMMYTSGSTGKPKGVLISHANLIYSTQARFDYYDKKVDKFLLVSPLHFDSSVVGLYWTLCSGGTIVLPSVAEKNELAHWSDLICLHQITHVLCLPSVYRLLIKQSEATDLASLNSVIVAGEPCDPDICSVHYQKLPNAALYNEYGPTEACVWSSVHRCREQEPVAVSIGRPIPGTTIKIIGVDGSECPDGVEGELQLFGPGVANGYYKRPDITAKHFSSNPQAYKTGDSGYRSRNGEVFCTGRIDRQIKIRGQRIEPAEIEFAARRVEGVADVRAFAAIRGSSNSKRLWLAYTPRTIPVEQLKSTVQTTLPASMWPQDYLALESLPVLSNGKVSERILAELLPVADTKPHDEQPSVVENEINNELLGIVNSLLGEKNATMNNNAHQCGMDSIEAMKLTAQLRERFKIDLRLVSVLQCQSWSELGSQIEALRNADRNTDRNTDRNPNSENINSENINSENIEQTTATSTLQQLTLSSQQLPLWFLDQTGLQPEVYAVQSTLRCIGKLSLLALEYSVNALVHQNEVLRTRLRTNDKGEGCQVVLPAEPVQITRIEQERSNITWEQARDNQLSQRFDLENDQLLRVLLYQKRADEVYLMFHSHHIAMDGWSFDILHTQFAESFRRYHDAAIAKSDDDGKTELIGMPPPYEHQYGDFALWQQRLDPHVFETDTKFWCNVLAEPRQNNELPLDFPRPARSSFKGGSVVRSIDSNTIDHWGALARDTQATPFTVALAAVKTGLRGLLGVSDLLIGMPVSNRAEPRWQNMLGFFGNTVVVRTKSHPGDTLADSVLQTRAATLDALQHDSVPFDHVVRSLDLQGSTHRNPLFDVFFMYTHQHTSVPSLPEATVEHVNQAELSTAKFDLAIEIRPTTEIPTNTNTQQQGYELHLNYSTDLFRPETMDGFASDLISIMSATAEQSNKSVVDVLALLRKVFEPDTSDRRMKNKLAVGTANGSHAVSLPVNLCDGATRTGSSEVSDGAGLLVNQRLDQVFRARCVSHPDSIALQHNGQAISYSALDNLTDKIAQYLRQSDVVPGDVVAVSLPRSIHHIAVTLAVSRCEAVWCPINPEYPQARKNYMYSDSGARCVVAAPEAVVDEAYNPSIVRIIVDPSENPVSVTPRTAAAVDSKKPQTIDRSVSRQKHQSGAVVLMYTSGSTGDPKGVLLSHGALMNRIVWMWNRYPFANDDLNAVKTSCSFVDSLWESYGALLAGTPSVIIDDADVTDIACFLSTLRNHKVSRLLVVPSLLNTMLDWLIMHNQSLPDLKLCSCSGEVLPVQLAAKLIEQQPHTRLLNLYGSTEVMADVTCQEITAIHESENLPLGTAIDGVSMHILNEQYREVAPGETGEIALAGRGLAIGYHGDAELTTQKFIELQGVGRAFLSGDTGHIDNQGRLQFDGRKDRLVKVRGVRVNSHEIEQKINSLPGVVQSLVFAQGELDERQLCAVVQVDDNGCVSETPGKSDLIEQLQELLPINQLPDRYQLVNALPLLPNGKPDRHAAAALMRETSTSESPKVVSSSEYDERISTNQQPSLSANSQAIQQNLTEPMLTLWRQTLNDINLSVDDDFFEAGGYSLLAVKLVMRVNTDILAKYNSQMTIGDVLEKRTVRQVVAQQAEAIRLSEADAITGAATGKKSTQISSLMTLQTGTGSSQLFMIPPFGDTGFFYRKFASHVPKHTSVYSFDMAISVHHDSVNSLCSALVDELLGVQSNGPWVIVAGCLGNVLALEMAHQLKERTGKECELYLIDSDAPREGPGWKQVKQRRTGLDRYWAIIRKEFTENYGYRLIQVKIHRLRAVFDAEIRKYLDVRMSQSKQFVKYKAQAGSADITLFRSNTFMKKSDVVERWALLTAGKFELHDFPDITHEKLMRAESPYWSRVAKVVLQSRYLQSVESTGLSMGTQSNSTVQEGAITGAQL